VRIAMVCLGNICRSPMAAAIGGALVGESGRDDVHVESFGTAGYHEGEPADPRTVAALRRHGWPAEGHRARRLRADDLADLDLVLCADHANLAAVRRLAADGPGKPEIRLLRSYDPAAGHGDDEVPDPWSGGDAEFDTALRLVEQACRGLVAQLVAGARHRSIPPSVA
jgi:protein-tyrosine phosphatase